MNTNNTTDNSGNTATLVIISVTVSTIFFIACRYL
jgi:hypothetical protein